MPEGMGVACVEEGTICPVCGHDFDSGIGHDWQSNGDGTHSCTRCDVAAESCTGGEAANARPRRFFLPRAARGVFARRARFLKDLLHNGSLPFAFLP